MSRRGPIFAALLLALVVAGALLLAGLGGGAPAPDAPLSAGPLASLPTAVAPAAPAALPAAGDAATPTAPEESPAAPAHISVWRGLEPGDGSLVRYSRHGRFGGRRSFTARSGSGRRSRGPVLEEVLVEFENGQPVGGAEHFDADGKRHAETDGRGIARAAGTR
ncbi:MAG: hypothetical protein ACYTGX_14410, partial [Planctomycetota bacterium]